MSRAAVFDLDGLLVDSEPLWREAERAVFRALGVPVPEQPELPTASMSTRQVTEYWYRLRPWDSVSLEEAEARVVRQVAASIATGNRCMPGARNTLEHFRAAEFRLAVATNAPSAVCAAALAGQGLDEFFEVTATADDVARPKPAPDVYLAAAARLAVDPARCIVFEDSLAGATAALDAGMTVLAVPSRPVQRDRFKGAHRVLTTLREVDEALVRSLAERIA